MGGGGEAVGVGWNKEITDGREDIDEPLLLALASSYRLMGVLR